MSGFDEYHNAGKDVVGARPQDVGPLPPLERYSRWKEWGILAACLLGVAGMGSYYYLDRQKEVVVEPPPIVKPVEKTKVIYKTRWKTQYITKWRDSPPIIKYLKDPRYDLRMAELEQNYRRRARMLKEFYAKPLKPGETRKLRFESACPGFENKTYKFDNVTKTPTIERSIY